MSICKGKGWGRKRKISEKRKKKEPYERVPCVLDSGDGVCKLNIISWRRSIVKIYPAH